MCITKFGKKLLSFFAVFFLTLLMVACDGMGGSTGGTVDRSELKEAKSNVEWLLANFSFGDVINDVVKEPVIGNVGIAEDIDGIVSENDLRNGSYSEFMYGMSASFESSNPEVMKPEWVTYKKRAYVYDSEDSSKIVGIETQYVKALEFAVNRPEPDQEDVQVEITIKVKAPYKVGERTHYYTGSRTLTFNVAKKAVTTSMSVGDLEQYILDNYDAFNAGTLFKDENGNDLNVTIEGVVTEQVWGDGYDSHSFALVDDEGNGIYVYGPQGAVNIGDRVQVTGKPGAYNGTIQIGLKSSVEVVASYTEDEMNEFIDNVTLDTTLEEWYAQYPNRGASKTIPGQRVKFTGILTKKVVGGYNNYAILSSESDYLVQIYYKSYGAYEEELLKELMGKKITVEGVMYYAATYSEDGKMEDAEGNLVDRSYWVVIVNNYDYQPELIEMTAAEKLQADLAGIKTSQTIKNGETIELPKGTLDNGTVLGDWTADLEGYIDLETLVASLGNAKEDVKVTLTTTATNGSESKEVSVEVTIKYVKGEITKKTVAELIAMQEEMLETFKVTGKVVQWGNKLDTPADAPTKYGNFILEGEDGSRIIVYGATASESALAWDGTAGKYKYTNAQDFLSNELTASIVLGDTVELLVVRTSYNGNPQLNAVVLGIKQEEVEEPTAHLLGVYQAALGKTFYVTGNIANERYLETTEDPALAAKVYIEEVEGGSRFYILDGETKKYLDTYLNDAGKISLRFDAASECVYKYNEETKAWETTVDGTDYYFGTYGTFNTMSASKTSYINAENTGVSQFPGFLEEAGKTPEQPEPPVHEHEFVNGECACGEKDPNYVAPELGSQLVFDFNADQGGMANSYNATEKELVMNGLTLGYVQMKSSGYEGSNFLMFCKNTEAHLYNKTATPGAIVKIEVVIPGGASPAAKYYVSLGAEALAGYHVSKTEATGNNLTITLEASAEAGYKYFNISADSTTNKNGQVQKIIITLEDGTVIVPPVHEHKFVDGKCSCGEVDPDYVAPEQPVEGESELVENVAYLLGINQVTLGKVLYVTGNVANVRYLEMTEDAAQAAKVYAEKAEGGYKFYILDGETKKYLDTYFNAENKVSLQFAAESTCVYSYNAETKAWATTVDGTDYYFGTYSNFNTMSASKTSYISAENTGVSQFPGFFEKAEAGETPEQPEPPVHEHVFVEGKCECGEADPDYVAPEQPETAVEISFSDVANRTAFSTEEQVWEQNGIKVTNNKGDSTSNVADYSNPARFYKSSSLTVSYAEGFTTVEITCNSTKYATALQGSAFGEGVTATANGKVVTLTFAAEVAEFTVVLTGGQVRVDSIEIA